MRSQIQAAWNAGTPLQARQRSSECSERQEGPQNRHPPIKMLHDEQTADLVTLLRGIRNIGQRRL